MANITAVYTDNTNYYQNGTTVPVPAVPVPAVPVPEQSSPCSTSTRHSCVPMLLNTNNVIVHHLSTQHGYYYGNHYNGQLGGYYIIPGSLSTSSTAYKV